MDLNSNYNQNGRRPYTGGYVYGTAAPKIQPKPRYNSEEEILRRQERREEIRRENKRRSKPRIDMGMVLLVVFVFSAVMLVGIWHIHVQFQATYMGESIVKLQNEIVNIEKDNAASKLQLAETVDLSGIYNKATKELGMKQANKNQICYYKSTQVRQYGNIPSN